MRTKYFDSTTQPSLPPPNFAIGDLRYIFGDLSKSYILLNR